MLKMKIVVISDSFKGSLSSGEIVDIFNNVKDEYYKEIKISSFPVADGGEGTVSSFASFQKGKIISLKVHDSFFNIIDAHYFINDKNEAIIEIASSSALTQVGDKKDPSKTSTYGIGEQIYDAIKKGIKKIYIGLGGSSTNDMATGAACALGSKFYDKNKHEFIPTGGTLIDIADFDISKTKELLKDVEIICLSDVNNPTFGLNGAAYVYARQKGADDNMIKQLDDGLIHLSKLIKEKTNIDVSSLRSGGAAGAFGAGAYVFFNALIQPGIDTILKLFNFEKEATDADYIFTGEGKIDKQTLYGKTIFGIAQIAKKHNVPIIAITGSIDDDIKEKDLKELGIIKQIEISKGYDIDYSIKNAKKLYKQCLISLLKELTKS